MHDPLPRLTLYSLINLAPRGLALFAPDCSSWGIPCRFTSGRSYINPHGHHTLYSFVARANLMISRILGCLLSSILLQEQFDRKKHKEQHDKWWSKDDPMPSADCSHELLLPGGTTVSEPTVSSYPVWVVLQPCILGHLVSGKTAGLASKCQNRFSCFKFDRVQATKLRYFIPDSGCCITVHLRAKERCFGEIFAVCLFLIGGDSPMLNEIQKPLSKPHDPWWLKKDFAGICNSFWGMFILAIVTLFPASWHYYSSRRSFFMAQESILTRTARSALLARKKLWKAPSP